MPAMDALTSVTVNGPVAGLRPAIGSRPYRSGPLSVPKTSSTSRDQAVFVDQAADAGLFPDAVLFKIDRFG